MQGFQQHVAVEVFFHAFLVDCANSHNRTSRHGKRFDTEIRPSSPGNAFACFNKHGRDFGRVEQIADAGADQFDSYLTQCAPP